MKQLFTIAAALIATLPLAHATSLIDFVFTGNSATMTSGGTNTITFNSTGDAQISMTAWGFYDNGNNAVNSAGTIVSGAPKQLTDGFNGLGVTATNDLITNSSFVVFNFAAAQAAGYTTASIELNDITEGWTVYGTNTIPKTSGGTEQFSVSAASVLATGKASTDGKLEAVNNFASYNYIIVIASQDCQAVIDEFQLTERGTSTPEPGTFLIVGMALLGLGTTLRKARKK